MVSVEFVRIPAVSLSFNVGKERNEKHTKVAHAVSAEKTSSFVARFKHKHKAAATLSPVVCMNLRFLNNV